MQLTEDNNTSHYQILAYNSGQVTINDQTYTTSLIISPTTLIPSWPPRHLEEINEEHIQSILALSPEIILLGTGAKYTIPPLFLRQFDCMDTGAACRTFAALTSEGRNVAAALLIN